MNYEPTPRSNRPKGFMLKHGVQLTLFAAFSLWLLYQVKQPAHDSGLRLQLSNNHISNVLGRKGSAGLSKSTTLDPHYGLTLDDVTNPGEEGEIRHFYTKEVEVVEFYTKTGGVTTSNDDDGSLNVTKLNISFSDENGIPQHVRDKFIGTESNDSVNRTNVRSKSKSQSQSQSKGVVTTSVGDGRMGLVEKS